jgi:hypothetical protein
MAANHSTLATIPRGISSVPRIAVPDIGVTESEYGQPAFTVRTPFGPIFVEALTRRSSSWLCRGSAESLAAHNLLRPDWLPGLPGNNKVSQTVFFGDDGPELFRGNRAGRKFDAEFITIKRVSSTVYTVVVPATAEQSKNIKLATVARRERELREREAGWAAAETTKASEEAERLRIRMMAASASEVRDSIRSMVSMCDKIVTAHLEASGYRFDAAADRGIGEQFKQLLAWIDRGDLQDAGIENLGANVTRLRYHRVDADGGIA